MKTILFATTLSALALPAAANDFQPAMETFLNDQIMTWAADPVIVDAVRAQNARTAGLGQDQIDALDQAWRGEVGKPATPTITPVLENAAADFLRAQVDASQGRITEIILMDARGLNVAVSAITSDMWQGDEEKHSETYMLGAGAAHFSAIELDESTGRYQGQISFTLVDPATGDAVGAMTVGIDAESLM